MTAFTTVLVPHQDGTSRYQQDVPGWAYPCGFTVMWFPTKDIAEERYRQDLEECDVVGAVGEIEPTTANEAAEWAAPHTPSGQWGW